MTEWAPPLEEHEMDAEPTAPTRDPLGSPLDWLELFATDAPADEWIVEPIIAAGRGAAIYSVPKVGKSLLALELAAAVSTGGTALGSRVRRRRVLYVDMENDPRGDVRTRLEALGYDDPAELTGWLVYHSFPTLAALDTPAGGRQLVNSAIFNDVDMVVIDTVSRTVSGEEDRNDTWLDFYRHTGLPLKRAGIAMLRLDHAGKDASKGQRGGSAKGGDVDAVWRLSKVTDDTFRLECEMARQQIATRSLTLRRRSFPLLRHELTGKLAAVDALELDIVAKLDELRVPRDAGRETCRQALKSDGVKASTAVLAAAIKRRKTPPSCPGQVAAPHLSEDREDSRGQVSL